MNPDRFRLYDAAALVPVIDDMARQLALLLDDTPIVLLGVLRRGAPLADRLRDALLRIQPDAQVSRMDLLVKRYADDLTLLHPDTRLDAPADAGASLRGRRVIAVDDVLYQGYSLFRVCEWLRACQRVLKPSGTIWDPAKPEQHAAVLLRGLPVPPAVPPRVLRRDLRGRRLQPAVR